MTNNPLNLKDQWNNKNKNKNLDMKEYLTLSGYWKHIGGLFILSARQTGKTTQLVELYKKIEKQYPKDNIIYIAPYKTMLDISKQKYSLLQGLTPLQLQNKINDHLINVSNTHLLIDEFMYIDKSIFDKMLNYNWNSVTGISSLL